MSIAKCVRKQVVTIAPDADLVAAAECMRHEHVGLLIVLDQQRKPLGVLTDRDIVVQAVTQDISARSLTVRDVMTPHPAVAYADESVDDVTERMRCVGVRRLPVVDDKGMLCGVVSSDDIIEHLAGQMNDLASIISRERRTEQRLHD